MLTFQYPKSFIETKFMQGVRDILSKGEESAIKYLNEKGTNFVDKIIQRFEKQDEIQARIKIQFLQVKDIPDEMVDEYIQIKDQFMQLVPKIDGFIPEPYVEKKKAVITNQVSKKMIKELNTKHVKKFRNYFN